MLSTITERTMSSREIAEVVNKRHDNVLRDIRSQLYIGLYQVEFLDNSNLSYPEIQGLTPIYDEQTKRVKEILLDRDHSLTLVTGYDVKARHAINKRWMELEETQSTKSLPAAFNLTQIATDLEASHRIALFFGLEGNQAKLKADKCIKEVHGVSPMLLLGIELTSPIQARLLTPTEIGRELGGTSAQTVNKLLQSNGLQERNASKIWVPTAKGREYSQLLDVNKDHSNGTPVQQLKWFDTVIDLIK